MDAFVRAARRAQRRLPPRAVLAAERWSWPRGLAVGSALVSFYISYLAYRNLKGAVPLLRPDYLLDRQLADLDRVLFLGSDPADLTHAIFGTGAAAEVLSVIYLLRPVRPDRWNRRGSPRKVPLSRGTTEMGGAWLEQATSCL